MKWELTDGTTVALGGDVQGTSAVAAKLRSSAARARKGAPDALEVGTQPGAWRDLDLDDPQLVNVWVRTAAERAGVGVMRAPELEPLKDDSDPGEATEESGRPVVY